jgi:hypothetical protein
VCSILDVHETDPGRVCAILRAPKKEPRESRSWLLRSQPRQTSISKADIKFDLISIGDESFFNNRLVIMAPQAIRQRSLKERNAQRRKRSETLELKVADMAILCDYDAALIMRNRETGELYSFRSSDSWRPNMEDIVSPYNTYSAPPPLTIVSLRIPNLGTSFLEILRRSRERRRDKD